jgi:glycosyltransferase involved in cell wall biosynthesis
VARTVAVHPSSERAGGESQDLPTVVVVGPLPPPVHGQSKNTLLVAEAARAHARVRVADTSPRLLDRSLRYYWRRALRIAAVWWTILRASRSSTRSCYLAVDSRLGLVPNISYALLARVLRFRLVLHHRTFGYVDSRSRLMSILTRVAGRCLHVFLCEAMEEKFCGLYAVQRTLVVSNAATLSVPMLPSTDLNDAPLDADDPNRPLVLGILGNLTFDKGLREFAQVVRALGRSRPTVGVLAGAAGGAEEAVFIDELMGTSEHSFRWLGPVGADARLAFLDEIDIFLFPTCYKLEAQPNVIFEAMARGVPIVATMMGCIASDVPAATGATVPLGPDLVGRLQKAVLSVQDKTFPHRRRACVRHIERLRSVSAESFSKLVDELTGTAPSAAGSGRAAV